MAAGQGSKKGKVLHKGLVPAKLALQLVLDGAKAKQVEMLPLAECFERVLAEDLVAKRTQPPFPASAMDGYGVRFGDFSENSVFSIIGESAAGRPFSGKVGAGECVRIFTGAPVPEGADTVFIQENAVVDGSKVRFSNGGPKGKFVRPAGLDFKSGEKLLLKNTVIDAQSLSLAASMGHGSLPVFIRPVVCVLATGDELVLPGEDIEPGQIIASNTFGVAALAGQAGATVINLGIARDTMEDLSARIRTALEADADLIVTTGGASVGDHDLVKPVMAEFGFEFSFVKIAMRPGKPVIFGKAVIEGRQRRFLGLAGNPVSSLVSSHIFLKPLIRLLGGYPADTIKPVTAVLDVDMPANDERKDYMRGVARRGSDGELLVAPFEKQDSSMLATLSKADCLIIRPVHAAPAKAGDSTQVILLRDV